YEMDYLQEGIHLRAMGQKDPLTEWQREGYAMFQAMMGAVADDFVKYVMHLQMVQQQPVQSVADEARNIQTSGPDQTAGSANMRAAAAAGPVGDMGDEAPAPIPNQPSVNAPVVKSEHEKVGRNDPCWCGSGKKFKKCHGV
ncbi:MAG TPA: SEC-C metal-binding domain-containing protein, partial [Gaiellaceae bacterium]|nr:SEC-C metal-binding domain-containing protein [Gaiellaceae bacterium]